jgi:GT2 family glycosyltransferase
MKRIFKVKQGYTDELLRATAEKFGLPRVSSSLAIYFYKGARTYAMTFENAVCSFSVSVPRNVEHATESQLFLEEKTPFVLEQGNIKSFLKFLAETIKEEAFIGKEVIRARFFVGSISSVDLFMGTPLGDIVVARDTDEVPEQYLGAELSTGDVQDFYEANTEREHVFNNVGSLHERIVTYGNLNGLPFKEQGGKTIKNLLEVKSNDYSLYERVYHAITDRMFGERLVALTPSSFFKPCSIIIPAYNSGETIQKVLFAIEAQELKEEQKKALDVVIVDDGSSMRVIEHVTEVLASLSFEPRVVRNETNQGLVAARNLGVSLGRYDHLIFVDSDILLAKNYLAEHSMCAQMFPQSIFVSMKQNINKDDESISAENIKKGLAVPKDYNDKRIARMFPAGSVWHDHVTQDTLVEVLSETRAYKDLGYGRKISGYDLPAVVVGHNMSMSREVYNRVGGFSDMFSGYGMEDVYFGACAIARGCFVIPVLETGVYHIDHPPRSGKIHAQQQELDANLTRYHEALEQISP